MNILDHMGLVFKLARRYDRNNYEDLAQEGLLALWSKKDLYDSSKGAESTFVYKVVSTRFMELHRSNHNPKDVHSISIYGDKADLMGTIAHEGLDTAIDLNRLGLTKREMAIVVLLLKGLQSKEIAEKLGMSTSNLRYCKRKLKLKLGELIE